ncbi:rhomboid family intramembrane serine protease [Pelobium manganitolerans]|uniref:Rhomboid family intramembrane serine protease n=1 Tax=Pelobium manganitolerans TaxID=1842495 RepID=A0A419S2S7_9SPHI|nr:rhomboid family intramembrane serine protease [Pelobium manganitolerans]RKD13173.1 rhomboid family intramembrane serine protease [Pelobium manganitolerans]
MQQFLNETPVSFVIFVFTIATSVYAFYNPSLYGRLMLHPYSVSRGKSIFQLLSSGFVHKDWQHLIFNMLSYYFFAFNLERAIGHWQFALLYLLSLILSDLPTVQQHKNHYNYHSLGASGAVCAVLFSYILFSPFSSLFIIPIPFPIPAIVYGVLFLVYSSYASRHANDGINHDAHFYGAISGVLITVLLYPQVIQYFISTVEAKFGI